MVQCSISDATNHPVKLAFAHRRLAIIDTSPLGHQPMCDQNQNFWIAYNGEIYNFLELRQELTGLGYPFHSQTDTEVILAAWSHWGEACVKRFNGMWAFALLDKQKGTVTLSRDRIGVKPLYYKVDDKSLTFASEHKALLHGSYRKKINEHALAQYFLSNDIELLDESLFAGIHELPPGHHMTIGLGITKIRKWYDPSFEGKNKPNIEQLREQLLRSVRLRLISDVPVGSCLSGGLDSSSIVGMIHHLMKGSPIPAIGNQQRAFTISFPKESFDETKYAQQVVERAQIDWTTDTPTTAEFLSDLEEVTLAQDLPLQSASTYAQFRVMKLAAANGVKVLLDGQGADELFGGYPHHVSSTGRKLKETIKQGLSPTQLKHFHGDLQYLNPDFLSGMKKARKYGPEPVRNLGERLKYDYYKGPLKMLLKYEDRSSMWHSIESRTPFADDHELAELVFSIADKYKIVDGRTKALLRDSMKPFLPEAVYERRDKMGFVAPTNRFMREGAADLRVYLEELDSPYLSKSKLLADYDQLFKPEGDLENYRLFKYLGFAIWCKVFKLKS